LINVVIEFQKYIEMEKKIISEKDAAEYFQISEKTLGNWRREGKFECGKEFIYVGKQIRYKLSELLRYFELTSSKII